MPVWLSLFNFSVTPIVDIGGMRVSKKASKYFNWATGKDNLFLAMVMSWIAEGSMGLNVIINWFVKENVTIAAICFLAFLGIIPFRDMVIRERQKEKNTLAKDEGVHNKLQILRWIYCFGTLNSASFLFLTRVDIYEYAPVISVNFSLFAMFCFLSLDYPPYAKSMLKEWLKEKLAPLAISPEVAPQPT